nr:hypothetical protein [Tanacetum cinerariifolium]
MKSSVTYNEHEKQSSCFSMPNQSQENCFNTSIRAPFLSTVHQNSSSSSYFHNTLVRPPFQTTINQNSLSSSSFANTHVRPPFQTTINQNSLSSSSLPNTHVPPPFQTTQYTNVASPSSSTHSQSFQSHPIQYETTLHQTSGSSSSLLDNELLLELQLRFSLPERKSIDDVIFEIMDDKFKTLKYRLKMKLFGLVTNRLNELNEANNIMEDGEQEMDYTEDELLQALDLIEAPEYFMDHRW